VSAITKKEIYPTTGAAWQRAVQIWESYVVNEPWTLAVACGYTDGYGRIRMIVNDGTDETTYHLFLGDALDGAMKCSQWYYQPGWRYQPGAKLATYGARDTKANFNTHMVAARRSVYGFFASGASLGSTVSADCSLALLSANIKLWYFHWLAGMEVGLDVLGCPIHTPATDYSFAGDRVGNEGLLGDSTQISLSGGGVDIAPLVLAIQDETKRTRVMQLNNNGALYASESSEVIEPP